MDRVFNCKPSHTKKYDPSHYRVVFFSGAPIGVPFLKKLAEDKRFEVVGVVTMPDKARDRGHKVQENVIKIAAKRLQAHHPVLDPESPQEQRDAELNSAWRDAFIQTPSKLNPEKSEEGKEFCEWLKSLDADFFVTIAYGKIVPQAVLDIPKFAPINVHGSLLPKYRWASPIQSVFLHDETETGLTIMKMVKKMDAGPAINKLKIKIGFDWTAKTIIDKFINKGPKFLNDTLRKYGKDMLWEVKQDLGKVTFCSKIEKEDGEIDIFETPLKEVYNKYRAYALWPKIFFFLGEDFGKHKGKRVVVEKLVLDEERFKKSKLEPLLNSKKLNPSVTELIVKPEGKKTMSWEDFGKGYLLKS